MISRQNVSEFKRELLRHPRLYTYTSWLAVEVIMNLKA